MGRCFVGLAAALGLILLSAFDLQSETATVLHVFLWLFLLLVVLAVALWPSTGRDQRAELTLERPGWADRIDFKPAAPGTPAPRAPTAPGDGESLPFI